jgi:hypothetical protein
MITVRLANQDVEIYTLPLRPNKAWRQRVMDNNLHEVFGVLDDLTPEMTVSEAYKKLVQFLHDNTEMMLDAVLDYMPDSDMKNIVAGGARGGGGGVAFVEILKLAFNSDFLAGLLGGLLTSGSQNTQTRTSSPDLNGASGQMNSTIMSVDPS